MRLEIRIEDWDWVQRGENTQADIPGWRKIFCGRFVAETEAFLLLLSHFFGMILLIDIDRRDDKKNRY